MSDRPEWLDRIVYQSVDIPTQSYAFLVAARVLDGVAQEIESGAVRPGAANFDYEDEDVVEPFVDRYRALAASLRGQRA